MIPEGLRAWTPEDRAKGREAHTAKAKQRKRIAIELDGRGWSIDRIANHMKIKPRTVREYLKEKPL